MVGGPVQPKALQWLREADAAELKIFALKRLGDDRIGYLRANSYLHPYGFLIFRLGLIEPGWGVRLHIWPDQQDAVSSWRIHNHAWWLYSRILIGDLTNYTYDVGPAPEDSADELYTVESSSLTSGESILVRDDRPVRCALRMTEHWREGDLYPVEKFVFHDTVVPHGAIAATLVFTELVGSQRPQVIGPAAERKDRIIVRRRVLELNSTNSLLERVLNN